MADTEMDYNLKTITQVEACGYEALQRKGQGTYGFVYEVANAQGDLFAFKYILPDGSYKINGLDGLNEIDILTRIHHPHIIHAAKIITAHNCEIDGLAIVLPLADRTLFDIIKDPTLTTDDKLPIFYKLATALEFMGRCGILHLDIKSSNVVLQGIKENNPYFIDFGLSVVVDDVSVGKYIDGIRVTIDHRAPEILNGGRIYNGAVDVWAFGIMMLYVLSSTSPFDVTFATIKDKEFYNILVRKFSTPTTIINLLHGVREKYRAPCIDLLNRILKLDPKQRLTAKQICDHPVFDEFRVPIDGSIIVPPIPYNYANDHRDILKLLIYWASIIYPTEQAELLFLAIDIFNRCASFFKERSALDRMSLAASCLWVASKFIQDFSLPLPTYVPQLQKMVKDITSERVLNDEIEIIHLLEGILDVSALYRACTTGDELKLSLMYIIRDKDSTLYARTNIPEWIQVMKTLIPVPVYQNKSITIQELMQ